MRENEIVVDDLSIRDFKEYLRFNFAETKNLTHRDFVRSKVEKQNTINDNNLYFIENIRQFISFFRGMDNESHDIIPSIKRLYGNPAYYKIQLESNYIKSLLPSPFINEREDEKITINLLARMQHYNYKSRLVDITFNYVVAVYMSSYTGYLINGKVIEFTHKSNNNLSRYANVLERYHYIASPSLSLSNNLRYLNYLVGIEKKPKLNFNYESNPVVIIDRQTFKHNTAAYDLRYDAQEGAFIMFLNDKSPNDDQTLIDLNCRDLTSRNLSYRRILSENKIVFLYLLAKSGVTHITIYPDKDLSHEVNKINSKISFLSSKKSKFSSLSHSIDEYIKWLHYDLILNSKDIASIKKLAKHYMDEPNMIEFLLSDYLTILEFRALIISSNNNHEIVQFNKAAKNLITESINQDYSYLLI